MVRPGSMPQATLCTRPVYIRPGITSKRMPTSSPGATSPSWFFPKIGGDPAASGIDEGHAGGAGRRILPDRQLEIGHDAERGGGHGGIEGLAEPLPVAVGPPGCSGQVRHCRRPVARQRCADPIRRLQAAPRRSAILLPPCRPEPAIRSRARPANWSGWPRPARSRDWPGTARPALARRGNAGGRNFRRLHRLGEIGLGLPHGEFEGPPIEGWKSGSPASTIVLSSTKTSVTWPATRGAICAT